MMTTNYVAARRLLPQRLQNLHQLGVNEFIAADQVAGLERIVVALDAADGAAGFAHDDLLKTGNLICGNEFVHAELVKILKPLGK